MSASSSSNFNYGYPTPGPQEPSGTQVMDHVFFLSRTAWKQVREEMQFDYIVIGTGPCGYAFAERVYHQDEENGTRSRILMIERGPFFLPEHFQNLPLPFVNTLGGLSETFPWTLSRRTHEGEYIQWQHGMVPFFGGRSIQWSAWCPEPTPEEMRDWPKQVIETVRKYFPEAKKLLNVVNADEIDEGRDKTPPGGRPIYGVMQKQLTKMLQEEQGRVPSLTRVIPAPLAVGAPFLHDVDFQKFATPGPLLQLVDRQAGLAAEGKAEPLRIVTQCSVQRVLAQGGRATALETTRGVVNIGDAKLVLAMGTLPPTTLVLNSFPEVPSTGDRFTAHFITSIIARVPRKDFPFHDELADLELSAIYVAGRDGTNARQFHIQLTALSDRNPIENAATAQRNMPDVVATASMAQLLSSKDYLVFVCAVLGEMEEHNPDNWFERNDGDDPTTNVTLQVLESETDASTWKTMDESTFEVLERILSPDGKERVEYWHGEPDEGQWERKRPPRSQIRVPGLVHEGSTLWIGTDDASPVGLDYRPRGVENVYVTGGGLWPTSGSWNPTPTMVALAQHLADQLAREK